LVFSSFIVLGSLSLAASQAVTWIVAANYPVSDTTCASAPIETRGYEVGVCFNQYNNKNQITGSYKYVVTSCTTVVTGTYNVYLGVANCPASTVPTIIPLPSDPLSCTYTPGIFGMENSNQKWTCSTDSTNSPLATYNAGYALTSTFGPKSLCSSGLFSQFVWSPITSCVNSTVNGVKSSYQIQQCSGSSSSTTQYVDDTCTMISGQVTSNNNCVVAGAQY